MSCWDGCKGFGRYSKDMEICHMFFLVGTLLILLNVVCLFSFVGTILIFNIISIIN